MNSNLEKQILALLQTSPRKIAEIAHSTGCPPEQASRVVWALVDSGRAQVNPDWRISPVPPPSTARPKRPRG